MKTLRTDGIKDFLGTDAYKNARFETVIPGY